MSKVSNTIKEFFLEAITKFLQDNGEEVLQVKSGTISLPWAKDGEEGYINITVSVPKGSKDEPYNGHEESVDYAFKLEQKAEKEKEKAIAKEKKMQKDAKRRAETGATT